MKSALTAEVVFDAMHNMKCGTLRIQTCFEAKTTREVDVVQKESRGLAKKLLMKKDKYWSRIKVVANGSLQGTHSKLNSSSSSKIMNGTTRRKSVKNGPKRC